MRQSPEAKMEDAGNLANDLPAIIIMSIWWALLSAVELMYPNSDFGDDSGAAATLGGRAPAPSIDGGRFGMLRQFDPDFDEWTFLKGAANAYETILLAFSQGNLETLQPLLAAEVFEAFASTIAGRAARQETLELTFIGFDETTIVHAEASSQNIEIDVRFIVQIVSLIRSPTGDVVAGDPTEIARTTDVWTFSRRLPANDATWQLVATDDG